MAAAPHQEIVELLRQVTGEDEAWAAGITPSTRVDTDLFVDSLEIVELGVRMREAYGVDLPSYLGGLDLQQLIDLTVADLAELTAA
ncbi:acyl carrier protein [Dactylosporangium sp. NPDC000521]|uniref:acyl carrier protein n=1 Tax=Dactylosporangium sp. NPDC000521 TaxID=3363975 RepID=UPI0036B4E8AE